MTCSFHHPATFCLQRLQRRRCHAVGGYSLTEMIWVVALLGIIGSIALTQATQSLGGSRLAAARHKLEMLNQALHACAMAEQEVNAGDASPGDGTGDESLVLSILQYRNTANPRPGTPYLAPTYRPKASSSADDYRLQWNGKLFVLLQPGVIGAGLKVPFDGSDFGTPVVYPPNYRPAGR